MGVRFISVQDQVDTESPMGRAMFTIIGAMAGTGSSLISRRVTAGMRAAEARGKHIGRPPTPPQIVSEIVALATLTDLSIRQIQARIAGRASRSMVGEITKGSRHRTGTLVTTFTRILNLGHPCRCRYHGATLPRLVPHRNADPARGADSRRVADRQSRQDESKVRNRRRGRTSALAHLEWQGEECQAQHRPSPQGHACLQGRTRPTHEERAFAQAVARTA